MAAIELKEVTKTFDSRAYAVHAVKNVSITIEKGQIFGIIGFSGAGKSTLVRCINLLERPTSGSVIVDGLELTGLNEKELRQARKKIGMIFQHFNLFASRTVAQNIAYPLLGSGLSKAEIAKKVDDLLELVELQEKRDAYPSELSGGQKQRVAIARALVSDPHVLLCDEATSALDPQTTAAILDLLRTVNQKLGLTIVVITHEMSVVKEICTDVAVMDRGEVVEKGDVFTIFADPKQEVTRNFIRATSSLNKIHALIAEKSPVVDIAENELIIQLNYLEKNVSEALVSTLSRNFAIDLNIIFSDIEIINGAPIGGVVAIISGERKNVEAAMKSLIDKNVGVDVLLDGRAFREAQSLSAEAE